MPNIELNYLDYAVITIMTLSVLFGLMRGFVSSVLSFVGWIMSLYLSYAFLPHSEAIYASSISNPAMATVVAYMTSMLVSLIGFGLINMVATKAIGMLLGGVFDNLLGAIFGAMRGGAIISGIYLCFVISWNVMDSKEELFSEDKKDYPLVISSAYTYNYVVRGKDILVDLLPVNAGSLLTDMVHKKSLTPDGQKSSEAPGDVTHEILDRKTPDLKEEVIDLLFSDSSKELKK